MMKLSNSVLALLPSVLLGLASLPLSTASVQKTVFESQIHDETKIRYVKDSGVCETTPGVHQLSGYLDVGQNMSMWFWFFEARSNPDTAPFTLWINGGPGCSSMIGLFQEHGPCSVNEDGNSTSINPYSWNNVSNVIYIDQPIGTGFSYGDDPVNSTWTASPYIWKAFQVLFESGEFDEYASRELVFTSESYGGHYGPAFVSYFNEQNEKIDAGELEGEKVVVSSLLINNGWYDPLLQNQAYLDFATDAPGYGALQNETVLKAINESYWKAGGCRDKEQDCYDAGNSTESNEICQDADDYCIENVFSPAVGDRDVNDLRQNASSDNPFPSPIYNDFLANPAILEKIGAESTYSECADAPYYEFVKTGDDARSTLPELAALADSGLPILIWAGDTDINCNWIGGHYSVLAMDWYGKEALTQTEFQNITIGNKTVAAVQNVDKFSFARVYEAGHEVPAFQPEASLEIFKQRIALEPLHSV